MPRIRTLKVKAEDFSRDETVECQVCRERAPVLRYIRVLDKWVCSNKCRDKLFSAFRIKARRRLPKKKLRLVTLKELTSQWHIATRDIPLSDLLNCEWDELLAHLGIYCPESEGKEVIISDIDQDTFHNIALTFGVKE